MGARDADGGNKPVLRGFSPDASLFDLKPWRTMAALTADWGLIAAAFASALLWSHPITYLLAAIMIGRTQLALAVMMHESAHGTLLPQRKWNDAVGQACAAGPLFLSLKTYRAGHMRHHLAPMRADDPVALVFGVNDYPISRRKLTLRLMRDLIGIGYFLSVFKLIRGDYREALPKWPKSPGYVAWELGCMLASNALLFGVLALCGHPLLYLGLWTLPSVTLLPFFGRIRAIMEHAGLRECDDQRQNARTIIRPSWQTFLFGPHGIHYHIEHHLYVRMPFYSLGKLHRQMASLRMLPIANLYAGYGGVLRDVSSQPSASRPSQREMKMGSGPQDQTPAG